MILTVRYDAFAICAIVGVVHPVLVMVQTSIAANVPPEKRAVCPSAVTFQAPQVEVAAAPAWNDGSTRVMVSLATIFPAGINANATVVGECADDGDTVNTLLYNRLETVEHATACPNMMPPLAVYRATHEVDESPVTTGLVTGTTNTMVAFLVRFVPTCHVNVLPFTEGVPWTLVDLIYSDLPWVQVRPYIVFFPQDERL